MANKYTFLFNQSHNGFSHVDITILKDGVAIGDRRVHVEPVDSKEEDVLEYATDSLRSLRLEVDNTPLTGAEAKIKFEAVEFWR